MAAGRPALGPAGLHAADEGWLAPDRGRLRGRDLSRHLPALRRLFAFAGASAVAVLAVMAGTPTLAADLEAGRRKAEPCKSCHGPDGNATIPGTPSIAGHPTLFTHWQLIKYRDGRLKGPQISPFAASLSDVGIVDVAAYYAARRRLERAAT